MLSEVTRRYDHHFDIQVGDNKDQLYSKKHIVGLKTVELIPALDYYLTQLENSLSPVKSKTLLAVHYSNSSENENENPGEEHHKV